MREPGQLTLSGDLYEGNFEEWNRRLEACLRPRDMIAFLRPGGCGQRARRCHPEKSNAATHHIRFRVSDEMLARVPESTKSEPHELFTALKKLARPFRLLDLPAEIRNIIYEMVLPAYHWAIDTADGLNDGSGRGFYPAILHTSSQIRREALPIFYSTTDFCMDFNRSNDGDQRYDDRAMVEEWSKTLVTTAHLKYFRHIKTWICASETVNIRFSEKRGLTFDFDEHNQFDFGEGEDLLAARVEDIESTRKALDLKGESVVMAILRNWNLWYKLAEDYHE